MQISHEYLRSLLDYSPETGLFKWKISRGTKLKGEVAGAVHPTGYLAVTIDKKRYIYHRLAWFYFYGDWPNGDIDHINRNRADNRIANLRVATKSQNQHNTGLSKRNSSGYKGVYFSKRDGKYLAQIMIDRKRISLGLHDTAIQAHQAYKDASLLYHGEFSSEK